MSKDPMQRYAESLEKTIQHNYSYLKEAVEDFKGLCMVVTPEKHTPQDIIVDIRELYKEIRDRLAEIKAIQSLLQGKYRQYYRRDSLREKAIAEYGFYTKNLYSKFEYILLQKQALARKKEGKISKEEERGFPYQWFHSSDHQVTFVRNLRILEDLDYETPSDLGIEERREVLQGKVRSLSLFCFRGEASLINEVYSRVRFREHDLIERYAPEELHGLLTHLREIEPPEVEKVFKRVLENLNASRLKCLHIPIHSQKELEGDLSHRIKKALDAMEEGEIKTIII